VRGLQNAFPEPLVVASELTWASASWRFSRSLKLSEGGVGATFRRCSSCRCSTNVARRVSPFWREQFKFSRAPKRPDLKSESDSANQRRAFSPASSALVLLCVNPHSTALARSSTSTSPKLLTWNTSHHLRISIQAQPLESNGHSGYDEPRAPQSKAGAFAAHARHFARVEHPTESQPHGGGGRHDEPAHWQ
jgi:hypothetical protein